MRIQTYVTAGQDGDEGGGMTRGAFTVRDRSRVAPFAIDGRTLAAWMRGADLKSPA